MPAAVNKIRGFTLLELIVVLSVSVLGIAVLGGNLSSGNPATGLLAAGRDIASALRYARGQALLNRQPVAVTLDLSSNSYRIGGKPKLYRLDSRISLSLTVAEDEFSQGEGNIRFFPDGSSTGGRILLQWGEQSRQIDVNWITGGVALSFFNRQPGLHAAT